LSIEYASGSSHLNRAGDPGRSNNSGKGRSLDEESGFHCIRAPDLSDSDAKAIGYMNFLSSEAGNGYWRTLHATRTLTVTEFKVVTRTRLLELSMLCVRRWELGFL
jgi:hypothetical protein